MVRWVDYSPLTAVSRQFKWMIESKRLGIATGRTLT